jgi:hypothetical protein
MREAICPFCVLGWPHTVEAMRFLRSPLGREHREFIEWSVSEGLPVTMREDHLR